jgi:hypothetical protein
VVHDPQVTFSSCEVSQNPASEKGSRLTDVVYQVALPEELETEYEVENEPRTYSISSITSSKAKDILLLLFPIPLLAFSDLSRTFVFLRARASGCPMIAGNQS